MEGRGGRKGRKEKERGREKGMGIVKKQKKTVVSTFKEDNVIWDNVTASTYNMISFATKCKGEKNLIF